MYNLINTYMNVHVILDFILIHRLFIRRNVCFTLCFMFKYLYWNKEQQLPKKLTIDSFRERENRIINYIKNSMQNFTFGFFFIGCFVFKQFNLSYVLCLGRMLLLWFFALSLFFILSINVTKIIPSNMILEKSMVLLGLWIKHPLVFNHQGVCQFPTNMNNTTEYTMVLNKFNQRLVILNFGLTVINSYMITVDLSSSRLNPSKRWVCVSSPAYSGGQ